VTEVGPTTQPPVGTRADVPLPLGLWVVAALLVVGGVGFLMAVFDIGPAFLAGGLVGIKDSQAGQAILVISGVAMLLAAVGLLLRIQSAWGLTMLIVGLGLVVNLVAYFSGDPNFLRMASPGGRSPQGIACIRTISGRSGGQCSRCPAD